MTSERRDVSQDVNQGTTSERRWVAAELEPVQGRLRETPADFVVVEELAYPLSGSGTHSYLRIRKEGLSTFDAVRRIARALRRRERDVGYAGLKDKDAITEQWISIEHLDETQLDTLDVRGLEILERTRHGNKLKLGHLRGNRFEIRVRGCAPGDGERAERILALLAERGVPNEFGEQRFGRERVTPRLGEALLAGDWERFLQLWCAGEAALGEDAEQLLAREPRERMLREALQRWRERGDAERAVRGLPKRFLSLCTAALQSEVFNAVLEARRPALGELREGDIAYLHRNGACFEVEDLEADAPRAAAFEISPSGPLPGPACLRAAGATGELEAAVMARLGAGHERFDVRGPFGQKGGRRPLRVPLRQPRAAERAGDLELRFELPRGSFATAVLAELLRPRVPASVWLHSGSDPQWNQSPIACEVGGALTLDSGLASS
jgi:tRNA pseudouridine13 synthase